MPFINDDFLLLSDSARTLYHGHAEKMPIIDYHCHLPPDEVADDHRFSGITEAWLGGDHYKWRALRSNGISEDLVTGDAGDWEKFEAWAATMPKLLGNPLYHWTHLELARYFDVFDLLGPGNARDIYERCNARIAEDGFSARGLIQEVERSRHLHHRRSDGLARTPPRRPGRRQPSTASCCRHGGPTRRMTPENVAGFKQRGSMQLAARRGHRDREFPAPSWRRCRKRHEFFHAEGCRLSDHGIDTFYADDYSRMPKSPPSSTRSAPGTHA